MVNVTVFTTLQLSFCLPVCLSASPIVLSLNVCDELFLYVLREFNYPLSFMNFLKIPLGLAENWSIMKLKTGHFFLCNHTYKPVDPTEYDYTN